MIEEAKAVAQRLREGEYVNAKAAHFIDALVTEVERLKQEYGHLSLRLEAVKQLSIPVPTMHQPQWGNTPAPKQEQAEPVGRLMSWKGRGSYPAKGYTVARTWEECPKDAFPEDWEEGALIYTAPQGQTELLKQALKALELERPYLGPMPSKTSAAIQAIKQHLGEA